MCPVAGRGRLCSPVVPEGFCFSLEGLLCNLDYTPKPSNVRKFRLSFQPSELGWGTLTTNRGHSLEGGLMGFGGNDCENQSPIFGNEFEN